MEKINNVNNNTQSMNTAIENLTAGQQHTKPRNFKAMGFLALDTSANQSCQGVSL
jgi:hypothetical protein